jgi:predicted enzyme related to lactoylglutathione lyase
MSLEKAGFATLITIKDMDRALKFYTKNLGGKHVTRAPGEMKDSWASFKIGGEEFWLVNPPGKQAKKPDLAFFTFVVKNIQQSVSALQKKGVKFWKAEKMGEDTKIEGVVATDAFGSTAFFSDTEGNLLMLWQNAA